MNNQVEVKAGSIANAIDRIKPRSACATYNSGFRTYKRILSFSLKIKIFGIKVLYRPTKWPELRSRLPSHTQFRKLSGRRKRLVEKTIERYLLSKGVYNGNPSE